MSKQRICSLADVAPGKLVARTVGGRELCVARVADGTVYVVSGICSHEEYPLSDGQIVGCEIECSAHFSRFDLASGAVQNEPADRPIETFPAFVKDGEILVEVD